jgi:formylglycine-generating enzyme required for sulfatase activity
MSRLARCLLLALLPLAISAQADRRLRPEQAVVPPAAQEARVALVIGNGAYPEAPLQNPVNDARAMKVALESCKFQVTLLTDASKRAMEDAIRAFGEDIRGGAVGLFYFAGHGVQVQGENYLIPIGAKLAQEVDVRYQGVDVGEVLDRMDAAKNGLNILILDACRNNPFARSWHRGLGGQGLAQVKAPTGSLIAYATAPGSTAADGEGAHGLYTQALLRQMQEPGESLLELFQKVREQVLDDSHQAQVPWESNSTVGDFYFRPLVRNPTGPTEAQLEATYWQGIQDSRDVTDFETFLTKFPHGDFAELAKAKLANLKRASANVVVSNLAEPWKALVKDAFETDEEFAARIANLPWLPVGKAKVEKSNYDVRGERLLLPLEILKWAETYLRRRAMVMDLDRGRAKALVEVGDHQPLVAQFGVRKGQVVVTGLAVTTPLGSLVLDSAREVPPAHPRPGQVWHDPVSDLDFCWIPPGHFLMGSPPVEPGRMPNEGPQHEVTLAKGFWMGRTPVTQRQFQAVMGTNPSLYKNAGPDAPVEGIDIGPAFDFVRKLDERSEGGYYDTPSEAQWEYACRAGDQGSRYGALDAIAWYQGNSGNTTHPVAQKQPNGWGLYDMLGNVWEYCSDYHHDDYQGAPADGSDWLGGPGDGFMLRGGSFYSPEASIRFAARGWMPSSSPGIPRGGGFRVIYWAR